MSHKQKSWLRRDLLLGPALLGIMLVVAMCLFWATSMQSPPKDSRVKVVAAQNAWGDIATQLGGEYVDVTSIVADPSIDPHLYESNARDGLAVAQADIVIVNGAGYDDFAEKLLEVASGDDRRVVRVAAILNAGKGANPHLWYDIGRIDRVAEAITAQFVAKDPYNKSVYEARLRTFNQSLEPLLAKVAYIKKHHRDAPVAYTEPVPSYLLIACDLQNKTPEGFALAMEEGVEPSLADQIAMENLLPTLKIRALIYNPQAESPVTQRVRSLAVTANIPVVEMTETMPPAESSYQTWQLKQLDALQSALENKKQ